MEEELYKYFGILFEEKNKLVYRSVAELEDLRKTLDVLVYNESDIYIFKKAFYKCCLFLIGTQWVCAYNAEKEIALATNAVYFLWNAYKIHVFRKKEFRKEFVNKGRELLAFIDELIQSKRINWSEEEAQKCEEYKRQKDFFEKFGITIRLLEKRVMCLVNNKNLYRDMINNALIKYKRFINNGYELEADYSLDSDLKVIKDLLANDLYYEQGEDLIILFINIFDRFKADVLMSDMKIACFEELQKDLLSFNNLDEDEESFRNYLIVKAFLETLNCIEVLERGIMVDLLDQLLVDRTIQVLEDKLDRELNFDFRDYIKNVVCKKGKEYLMVLIDVYYVFKSDNYTRELSIIS